MSNVETIARNLTEAGWTKTSAETPTAGNFSMTMNEDGSTKFKVGTADHEHIDAPNSSKKFNEAISPAFKESREKGLEMTQPVGVPGSGWEGGGASGRVMEFSASNDEFAKKFNFNPDFLENRNKKSLSM